MGQEYGAKLEQADWKADIREGGATFAVFVVGLAIIWGGWALGFPVMGGIIGGVVIVEYQVKKAWHKTIRPAIIELIREALR